MSLDLVMLGSSVVDADALELEKTNRIETDDDPSHPLRLPLLTPLQLSQVPPEPADVVTGRELYPLSLLESLDPSAHRLLIHGPSQSGISSLLMDLACSLASQTPCRCTTTEQIQQQQQQPCRCTAVLILRPACNNDVDQEHFPMPCQRVYNNNNNMNSNITTNIKNKSSPSPVSLLHRIHVHHFANVRDVYTMLLQLQSLPQSRQPWGGILVDDVDQIVVGGTTSTASSNSSAASLLSTQHLSQLLAILVDTVNVLHHLKRPVDATPIRLAVASHHSLIGGGSGSNKMAHFWNPCCVEIQPLMVSSASSSSSTTPLPHTILNMSGFCEGMVAVRRFGVTKGSASVSAGKSSTTTDRHCLHASYAILRSMDEGGQIAWTMNG